MRVGAYHLKTKTKNILSIRILFWKRNIFYALAKKFSFIFKIRRVITLNRLQKFTFFYVNIYAQKIIYKKLIQFLFQYQNCTPIKNYTGVDDSSSLTGPLEEFWESRPKVQLLYSSDYSIFAVKSLAYERNIYIHAFIEHDNVSSPIPSTLDSQNTFLYLLTTLSKIIVCEEDKLFHVKNTIDGPLKYLVSLKAIASINDSKINNREYNLNFVSTGTLLNYPISNNKNILF